MCWVLVGETIRGKKGSFMKYRLDDMTELNHVCYLLYLCKGSLNSDHRK
jgi:hypothetical protein